MVTERGPSTEAGAWLSQASLPVRSSFEHQRKEAESTRLWHLQVTQRRKDSLKRDSSRDMPSTTCSSLASSQLNGSFSVCKPRASRLGICDGLKLPLTYEAVGFLKSSHRGPPIWSSPPANGTRRLQLRRIGASRRFSRLLGGELRAEALQLAFQEAREQLPQARVHLARVFLLTRNPTGPPNPPNPPNPGTSGTAGPQPACPPRPGVGCHRRSRHCRTLRSLHCGRARRASSGKWWQPGLHPGGPPHRNSRSLPTPARAERATASTKPIPVPGPRRAAKLLPGPQPGRSACAQHQARRFLPFLASSITASAVGSP